MLCSGEHIGSILILAEKTVPMVLDTIILLLIELNKCKHTLTSDLIVGYDATVVNAALTNT